MTPSLVGRPAPHLAARLAKHLAPDLLVLGMPDEIAFARAIPTHTLTQRVTRNRPAAAVRCCLAATPPRATQKISAVPTRGDPAPLPVWSPPLATPPIDTRPEDARLRADAAQGMRALKGLPAPFALLAHTGGWLFDMQSGALERIATPPPLEAHWLRGTTFMVLSFVFSSPSRSKVQMEKTLGLPRISPQPSPLAERLHAALPEGVQTLPDLSSGLSSHTRLGLGLSDSLLEDLQSLLPGGKGVLQIHQHPHFLAILRIFPKNRLYPVLLASFP